MIEEILDKTHTHKKKTDKLRKFPLRPDSIYFLEELTLKAVRDKTKKNCSIIIQLHVLFKALELSL